MTDSKSVVPQGTGSSNLPLSAINNAISPVYTGLIAFYRDVEIRSGASADLMSEKQTGCLRQRV